MEKKKIMSAQNTCEHVWNDNKVWSGGPSYIRMCEKCGYKESYTKADEPKKHHE